MTRIWGVQVLPPNANRDLFLTFFRCQPILAFFHQTLAMGDKRDAAMAGLHWPTSERTSTNPRTTGSTDSDMTDDIGHETFPPVAPSTHPGDTPHPPSNPIPPPSTTSYHHYHGYTHNGPWTPSTTTAWQMPSPIYPRERTVHTIYFKIWDPDSPARSLYVEEINQQGIVRQFDPEHFFHKLTGDHMQANQMSDYWRSHYGLPLKHGGTQFHPTWASSASTTTPSTVPAAAKHLATLLFGAQATDQLTSSGATSSGHHRCRIYDDTWHSTRSTHPSGDLPS